MNKSDKMNQLITTFKWWNESTRSEVLTALDESIKHWSDDLDPALFPQFNAPPTASNCALCKRFQAPDKRDRGIEGGSTTCGHCPLWYASAARPSQMGCDTEVSPYSQAFNAWDGGFVGASGRELEDRRTTFSYARAVMLGRMFGVQGELIEANKDCLAKDYKAYESGKSINQPKPRYRFFPTVATDSLFWREDTVAQVMTAFKQTEVQISDPLRREGPGLRMTYDQVAARTEYTADEAAHKFVYPLYIGGTGQNAFIKVSGPDSAMTAVSKTREINGNLRTGIPSGTFVEWMRTLDASTFTFITREEALAQVEPMKVTEEIRPWDNWCKLEKFITANGGRVETSIDGKSPTGSLHVNEIGSVVFIPNTDFATINNLLIRTKGGGWRKNGDLVKPRDPLQDL